MMALALWGFFEWRAGRVTINFTRVGGPVPDLELTVFPDQLSFMTPSPPLALGQVRIASGGSATFDSGLVPQRAVIRYRGAGIGTGVVFVELGKEIDAIALQPPRTVRGRVGEPAGFWSFGWRSGGLRPVADAEVVALAGGQHGVEVARTVALADGHFELSGISAAAHPLSLRVRAPGYAVNHVAVPGNAMGEHVVVAVEKTRRLRGKVDAPAGIDRTTLCVLARGLPGVQVFPNSDGSFVLDHLPPAVEPRLFVYGLGPLHGCAEVRAKRDADVLLTVVPAGVVRGTVTDKLTGEPLAGALVFAGDQPAVRSDADGKFELTQVLPGNVELTAQHRKRRPKRRDGPVRFGRARIELRGGETVDGVVVWID